MIQQLKNLYHLVSAYCACLWFGFPAKRLKMIGITGTDGKTTSSSLLYHILKSSGKKVSIITTVFADIADGVNKSGLHITNPPSFMIQKYLRLAVDHGHEYFILETTSHALDQNKMAGIHFKAVMITNITHDHLDYHKTYENYVKAKVKLLQNADIRVVNKDDSSFTTIMKYVHDKVVTYGLNEHADISFDISQKIAIPLAEYNKYNYLGVYAICKQLGLSDEDIFAAMKTYQLPSGRFEIVYDKDFKVVVDYAHTPNAIIQLLKAVKELLVKNEGRVIHIFGATGHRDQLKRPILGESSGEYADLAILTEEDPGEEDPVQLAYIIAEGLKKKGFSEVNNDEFGNVLKTFTVIGNRKQAIEKAVAIAKPGDVIVLTGMGHQKTIVRGKREEPWVEQEVVREVVENKSL
jgi:UDP-N-acetylmuramoyl-L-alanyl-D-glutamate--2,6-diaminopimelate ligase